MKILILTHFYPPERIGGTETYTHNLAKELVHLGNEVQVFCAGGWERGDNYWNGYSDKVFENVSVRALNLNWTRAPEVNKYLYHNPVVERFLSEFLAEIRPDIVHVTSCNTLSSSVLRVVKQAGVPLVVTLTDFWFICPRVTLLRNDGSNCDGRVVEWDCLECLWSGSKVYRWSRRILPSPTAEHLLTSISRNAPLARWPGLRGMAIDIRDRRTKLNQALGFADRVLIASQSARSLFRNSGFSIPIVVVPYGHDLSWLGSYQGKTPSSSVRFGFIGQIAPMKGPLLLIEAFRKLNQSGNARLLVYGDLKKNPVYSRSLKASANGCSKIEFRGTYPHSESSGVFSEIDVLVVPSLWHDYPLIINEAFATRTPVIASDFGGMRESVQHEVNGLLFERGNVQDLRRQLSRVITEPELLNHLRNGIPPVKTMRQAGGEMVGIYRDVLSKEENRRSFAEKAG